MIERVVWPAQRRGLIAVLRGIRPEEVEAVSAVLVEEGIEAIVVPLDAPDAFSSIRLIAARFGAGCLVGGGMVLSPGDVTRLHHAGGRLAVSPNRDSAVLATAAELGMLTMQGVFSPTEALLAWRSGASALSFFPACALGPAGIGAIRSTLPPDAVIGAVGGLNGGSIADYAAAGVGAFGLGSCLYRAGDHPEDVRMQARRVVQARDRAMEQPNRIGGLSRRMPHRAEGKAGAVYRATG